MRNLSMKSPSIGVLARRVALGSTAAMAAAAAVTLALPVLAGPEVVVPVGAQSKAAQPEVKLVVKKNDRRVDVLVGAQPFTSYIWPTSLKKPVLHPIQTADGVTVTRSFPPTTGEKADHPHHVGLWFNYGDVNGFDFWNNTNTVPADRAQKMGTIVHKDISRADNGKGKAELEVKADWVSGTGQTILEEVTTFRFLAAPGMRTIDRATLLRPTGAAVSFKDNKEGLLGLRVRRALEDPSETSGEFVDASGKPVKMQNVDTSAVTGQYTSSEGKTGKQVWGTRGKWTLLAGKVDGKPVTIAILDHPGNPGHPTYWHARGYGLFAANNLGQAALSEGKDKLNFAIPVGQSQLFRYRLLFLDTAATPADIDRHYSEWAGAAEPRTSALLH